MLAITVFAVVLVILNCAASAYVARASAYEPRQKAWQIAAIWLLPVLGAAFCSYFLYNDRRAVAARLPEGSDSSEGRDVNHALGLNHRGGR